MAARAEVRDDRGLPGPGMETILAAQRRYLEGWADANRIMADAMRTVVQRQVELAGEGMRAFWSEREAMLERDDARPADPVTAMCAFYERAFENFRESSDIMLKAQAEAMQVFSDCATASLEDMRKAA
jgi:hypothetical protein